jgi:hypothetical protein
MFNQYEHIALLPPKFNLKCHADERREGADMKIKVTNREWTTYCRSDETDVSHEQRQIREIYIRSACVFRSTTAQRFLTISVFNSENDHEIPVNEDV